MVLENTTVKGVTTSLGQDVKTLASDYGAAYKKAIAGFFHHGLCNLKSIPQKFQELKQDIVDAFGKFKVKPLEEYWKSSDKLEEAIRKNSTVPLPSDQPIVTILTSQETTLPMGTQLPLGEASRRIGQLDQEIQKSGQTGKEITFQIDFQQGKEPDRFVFAQEIGNGDGDLLDRIQKNIDSYQEKPELLAAHLTDIPEPKRKEILQFVQQQMGEIEKTILPYFTAHCSLSDLEHSTKQAISCMHPGMDTVKQIGKHTAVLSYVNNCRRQLNQSDKNIVLPELPAIKEQEQKETTAKTTSKQAVRVTVKRKQPSVKEKLQEKGQSSISEKAGSKKIDLSR